MKVIIFILSLLLVSCNHQMKIVKGGTINYKPTFIQLDTIDYGDRRFHEDVGAWIYGITEKGDTIQIKWIDL